MSNFSLKLLAIVCMLIDHTGAVLFAGIPALRCVGRLAFPIFCFLIGEGFLHTKSVRRYALRLFLFALASEIPFDLAFHRTWFDINGQNVFFTLFLGLCALWAMETLKEKSPAGAVLCAVALAFLAQLLNTDYTWYGVALIVVLYLCRENDLLKTAAFLLLNTGYSLLYDKEIQLYAAFAIVPILLSSKSLGKYRLKTFFYLFYPLHLLFLYIIAAFR